MAKNKLGLWKSGAMRKERDPEQHEEAVQISAVKGVGLVLSVPALAALLIYVIAIPGGGETLAVGLMTGAAAFGVGALAGFLFGIPRALAQPPIVGQTADGGTQYGPNTNLEQISDWLTKILVGVGLVQIGQLGTAVDKLADGPAESLGSNGHSVAVMLLISFFIVGFLSGYLYTRLHLQRVFEPFKEALKKQEEDLTSALPLVRAQLDPSGEVDPSVMELSNALRDSSSGIRDEAFYLARNQRRANWRGRHAYEDKSLVNLTIPVFEALVGLDEKRVFHRNRAELGYALKDRKAPDEQDYARARDRLSEAIEIRDKVVNGAPFPMYEFNRAFCNIKLHQEAMSTKIVEDLTVAWGYPKGNEVIVASDEVKSWLSSHRSTPGVEKLLKEITDVEAGRGIPPFV
jgi:hypothetical protein